MSAKLISIIGPPAVGKTTLAEALAKELPAVMVREDYAGNPFLADSYAGAAEAKLPGQVYFLMSRVTQLAVATWPAEGAMVSDYGFCQDRIYARRRLGEDDYLLYDRLARRVEGLVHTPDVVVYLDAAVPTLLDRIARRGRAFESVMDGKFLQSMRDAYRTAVAQMNCAIVAVDCDKLDLRANGELAGLIRKVRQALAGVGEICS
ncbi:MAG: deoxynucleoside kinase [Phycisphaerae bacterium]